MTFETQYSLVRLDLFQHVVICIIRKKASNALDCIRIYYYMPNLEIVGE